MYIDYNNHSYFGHLCELPKDVLNNLTSYYDIVEKTNPDQHNGHYKQWFIQSTVLKKPDVDTGYLTWLDNDYLKITKSFFEGYVDKIVRFRFSWLQENKKVDYHTNHMLPRIHIPLNDSGSVFVVKDSNGVEHSYKLEYGNAHFINVTLPHKVIGTKGIHRKNSFFSFVNFKDKNIESKFLK